MKTTQKILRTISISTGLIALAFTTGASAHHSFAIYDIDNKISRSGVLTSIRYVSPHIIMELEAVRPNGEEETWEIESMQPARFDREGGDREFVFEGDEVTLLGWPQRDGQDIMALSAIIRKSDGAEMVLTEEIRQGRARENLPSETIKREQF